MKTSQQSLYFPDFTFSSFPETKYMGSKQRLLPFIREHIRDLKFNSALDAFSGSGCVAYMLKQSGIRVYSNDFLKFCFHIGHATIENNTTRLNDEEICRLLKPNLSSKTFIRDTYTDLFFNRDDCEFLDNLWMNISLIRSPFKRSLALVAACRACLKKRPRGLFTFTGKSGWDGRRDLRLSMREQFIEAVAVYNASIFSNNQKNKAYNCDVFDLPNNIADLVYLDPPYISRYSDSDYTRRYHFVEGYCTYWNGVELMEDTKTKKFRSYQTAFSTKQGIEDAFRRLFGHFQHAKLVLSYSSNGLPSRDEIVSLLKDVKKSVVVHELTHRYHHGNHAHKVGKNNSTAIEYLFIAQ